jgi:serine phosphatase RsbU (regulator of sigma subunit)
MTPALPPRPRRRRPYLRAYLRALTDPRTFDVRRNPALWLGFLLAIPIPILSFMSPGPWWINLLSLTAPPAWAVLLGAAGRVALVAERDARRIATEAAAKEQTHRTEKAPLKREVATERRQREDLEAAHRLIETELKIAQGIQRTLIPPDIVRPDLQVVVRNIPCSYVGGDYLQAYLVRPDLLYLCVADVSGHGVAAALVVSRIHGHVRRLICEQRSPEQFLEELNRATLRIFEHTYFFMTFAVFRVDLAARRIDYATAGHPAQFLMRADGGVESLSTPNRLLGMDADIFDLERPSDSVAYGPGDALLLFTDGLFEIPGKAGGEMLGESGLNEVLKTLSGLPPSLVVGEILQDLKDFQGHSKFEDDVSLMVARFETAPVPSPVPVVPPPVEAPSTR